MSSRQLISKDPANAAGIQLTCFFHPIFFFFNDTATTEIYTLSLHDALPISAVPDAGAVAEDDVTRHRGRRRDEDRKSTRLNSSHSQISYAVFCLKKKKISSMMAFASGRKYACVLVRREAGYVGCLR